MIEGNVSRIWFEHERRQSVVSAHFAERKSIINAHHEKRMRQIHRSFHHKLALIATFTIGAVCNAHLGWFYICGAFIVATLAVNLFDPEPRASDEELDKELEHLSDHVLDQKLEIERGSLH